MKGRSTWHLIFIFTSSSQKLPGSYRSWKTTNHHHDNTRYVQCRLEKASRRAGSVASRSDSMAKNFFRSCLHYDVWRRQGKQPVWRRCVIGESWRSLCQSPCVTKVFSTTAAVPGPGCVRILVEMWPSYCPLSEKHPVVNSDPMTCMEWSDLKIPTYMTNLPLVFEKKTSRMMANLTAQVTWHQSPWGISNWRVATGICYTKHMFLGFAISRCLEPTKKQKYFYQWPSADLYPHDIKRNTSKV